MKIDKSKPLLGVFFFSLISAMLFCSGCQHDLTNVEAADQIKPAGIFSDNMVLQRNMAVPVWGTADPGKKVIVSFGSQKLATLADEQGKWMVKLSAMPASAKPAKMIIAGKQKIEFKNVLVGDVWLGSGQSNMWWPVSKCHDARIAIATSANPQIRLFSYGRKSSPTPIPHRDGNWKLCGPETVKNFSGVLYFFGREIQKEEGIPLGLIHSSVGGTRIQRWISAEGYLNEPGHNETVEILKRGEEAYVEFYTRYQKKIKKWLKTQIEYNGSAAGEKKGWSKPGFNDQNWQEINIPGFLEKNDILIDGLVWFRKSVTIPNDWVGKELTLRLGRIDDYDITFCNGVKVGDTGADDMNPWSVQRKYSVPASAVKSNKLTIAVQVLDIHGLGGMGGKKENFYVSLGDKKVSLAGKWRFKIEKTHDITKLARVPEPPASLKSGACTLYNGMINPLVPYAMRGVIWYQGESNASEALAYRWLQKTLIRDWRALWNQGNFPFIIAQLANFDTHRPSKPLPPPAKMPEPGNDSWAELREAQMMALSEPNTGVAVSIDIGDRSDIHPQNKSELGRRMALIAEKLAYGKNLSYSGPVYDKMEIEGNKIRLFFKHVDGGLVAKNGPLKWFAIAGKDRKFIWAKAEIKNNTVVVSSSKVKNPVAVRYAWYKNPEGCNLYNKSGLPASPFRTDRWGDEEN